LAETSKAIRTHGGVARHHHTLVGTNGRLDTIQAAIVLAKLPHFDWEVEQRNRIGALYSSLLSDSCVTPTILDGNTHVYAQYTIRVPDRNLLAQHLKDDGIPTAVYYPKCLHEQPVYASLGYRYGEFPASEQASREVISLPMHPYLENAEVEQIASACRKAIQHIN